MDGDYIEFGKQLMENKGSEYSIGDPDKISVKELILKIIVWYHYLLTKWLIILIAILVGGALGFFYAYFKKPLYTAELTFVVEGSRQSGGLGGYAGIAGQLGLNLGAGSSGGVFEGENLLALMKSRLMIERALLTTVKINENEKTLAEHYIDIYELRKKWIDDNSKLQNIHFFPGEDPSEFSLEKNSLISNLHGNIISKCLFVDNKDKKSSLISMRVISVDELFSKYFTEVLAKEVTDFYIDTKTKKSVKNLAVLQHQADSVRREFNAAISGVAYSMDATPNANPARKSLMLPQQRRQVDAEANQAMLMELMKNLAVSQISLREETPLIAIIDRPVLPLSVNYYNRNLWIMLGGISGGFLMALFFILRRVLKNIMD